MSKDAIKEEMKAYEESLSHVHTLLTARAREKLKQHLKKGKAVSDAPTMDEEHSSEEQPEKKSKGVKRRRQKTDISQFLSDDRPGKRVEADDELTEQISKLVDTLNEKHSSKGFSFKMEDSNKLLLVSIVRRYNDKDTVVGLVGKQEFTRAREVKPKNHAEGAVKKIEEEENEKYTLVKCYNDEDQLITNIKREKVKRGDLLKCNGKNGSPIVVPAVRSNVLGKCDCDCDCDINTRFDNINIF